MGVKVVLIGPEITQGEGLAEWEAGKDLKRVFENFFSEERNNLIKGEILIKPNFFNPNHKTKDIDIVVTICLENFTSSRIAFENSRGLRVTKPVIIRQMILVIELKSHTESSLNQKLWIYPDRIEALYKNVPEPKNVVKQNLMQTYSLRDYLRFNSTPFIYNMIWLKGISADKTLITDVKNVFKGSIPDFNSFLKLIIQAHPPIYSNTHDNYFIDSGYDTNSKAYQDISTKLRDSLLKNTANQTEIMGDLSRRKLELNIRSLLNEEQTETYDHIGRKLTILNGIAGSGKTFRLLNFAFNKSNGPERKSSLFLTFNKALISDLKRIKSLANFQDDPMSGGIGVETIHSFMYKLMLFHKLIPEVPADLTKIEKLEFSKKHFLNETIYSNNLDSLWKKLSDGCKSNEEIFLISDMLHEHFEYRNFDFVMIDEAQDWLPKEKDILYAIFRPANFVIAYGSNQLLRECVSRECVADGCDWRSFNNKLIAELQIIELEVNYRQKNNICTYVSDLLSRRDFEKQIKSNQKLPGGNITILQSIDFDLKRYENINDYTVRTCKNASFDNLILVGSGEKDQNFVNALVHSNRLFFDGTKKAKEFQSDFDAARIYHYESCRGLEGWCVINYNLDLFLLKKIKLVTNPKMGLSLEETKRYELNQWLYIILSRAIDTLIFTLDDFNSPVSRDIIQAAQDHYDYCSIEI